MPGTFPELDPYRPGNAAPPTTPAAAQTWLGQQMREDRDRRIKEGLIQAPPPDAVAKVTRLSQQTGQPPVEIEGNEDAVEKGQQAQAMARLAQQHPAIGKWAASNPRGVAAASDDTKSLGFLGTAWDVLKNTPGRFGIAGGWRLGQMATDTYNAIDEWIQLGMSPVNAAVGALSQATGIEALNPEHLERIKQRQRQQSGDFFKNKADAASQRFRGANPVSEGVLQGVETVPLTIGAVATRNPEAAAGIMGLLTGGTSYQQARREGLDPATALSYGSTQGAIEAITEKIPAGTLVDLISRKVPFAKAFVRELGQEMTGEQIATALQDLTDWAYLPENRSKTFGDYLKARPAAAFNTALAVAGGTSATTIGIHATQRAADATAKVAGKVAEVRHARSERQFFDQAAKAAEGSKLRERDPEAFRELVRHQAEEAGATHVFIPGEAVKQYQQSDSYDADSDPFDPTRWNVEQADAAGGDIVVPIHDLLTDVVGTPAWDAIKDDVRLTPGGMSSREAQAFQDQLDEVMGALSDEAAQRDKADKAQTDARAKLVNKIAAMFGESFTAPVARQIAEVVAQRAQTRASRLGLELQGNEMDDLTVRQNMGEAPVNARVFQQSPSDQRVTPVTRNGDASLDQFDITTEGASFEKAKAAFSEHVKPATAIMRSGEQVVFTQARKSLFSKSDRFDQTLRYALIPHLPEIVGNAVSYATTDGKFIHAAARVALNGKPISVRLVLKNVGDKSLRQYQIEGFEAAAGPEGVLRSEDLDTMAPDTATARNVREVVSDFKGEQLFHADDTGARGRIIFDQNRRIIELFQSRNLSTPLHELSHMWLEELRFDASLPEAPEQLKADWDRVKSYFAANGHPVGEDGQIPTEAHELWARSGERYFMEGKAPSSSLVRLFETFRSWLVQIYKTVDRLRAPISPEIREVFDRMLATDEEITATTEQQGLQALFTDAASAGMSADEFNAYQRQVDDARAEAHSKLLDKTMRAIRRRETERYRETRKEVRNEEQERIDNSPLFKAIAAIREQRLSKEWIADNLGADTLDLLPVRVPPLYVDGGVHPDVIAEQTGYPSGRDMIEALIGAERAHRQAKEGGDKRPMRERAIETATDAEMNRRYGDPLNDGSIEREALAAVHNDMQGEVIASELRVLGRKTGKRPTPYALAKEWARGKIRSGVVAEEASPSAIQRYARNAAKAGREAEAAMLKQDADETFRQKQFQMLNNALLSEAKAAADEVEAAVKRMDKIARATTRKSVDQDYLEQAQSLLEAVDLRKRSNIYEKRKGQWIEWAAAREAEGFDVVTPASFEATLGQTNWSRLTVENLLALDETVKQIMHLGRLKQTLLDNQEARDFEAVIAEAVDGAGGLKQRPPRDLMEPSWGDRFKSGVAAMDSGLLRMETVFDWLDGGNANGVFNRIAFRPIAEAQSREQDMLADYFGRVRKLFEAVPAKALQRWAEPVVLPFANRETGLPERMSRKQLISAALNVGNAGNLQRLADGYGWNAAALVNHLSTELSADEWAFVQGVWDTIDTLWPEIEAMERRVNGIAPQRVEATEIVTPHGTFRGGYYPAIYDSTRDLKTEERRGKESDLFESVYTRASTRSSATKERAEKVSRPILLDLGVINRHLGEVIHDITHREAVMQAHRFLTNQRVATAVDGALGPEIRKQFRPWVKFVANSWAMERAGNEGIGKFFGKLRANATAVGMGFRISTMVTQLAGYSNSIEVVGEKWIAEGIARSTAHPLATFNFVMERSGEMRHRMDTLDRDIRTAIQRSGVGRLSEVKRFMYHGIGYMDRVVAVPTWMGAYNKALSEGSTEDQAVYAADKAVRLSQGAGAPKDLAAIQRGTGRWGELLKAFTMFYSYFSAVYQRQRTLGRDVSAAKARDLPRLIARSWWLLVVPAVLPDLIKMAVGGNGGPDDDESWAGWAFKKLLSNSLGPIPFARDLVEPAWDKAAGNRSFGYSMSPLQRIGESFVNTAGDAGRISRGQETKHATSDALQATGYATGLVPGQIASAAQFLVDVGNGDADPQDFSDWWQGLTTGKLKTN